MFSSFSVKSASCVALTLSLLCFSPLLAMDTSMDIDSQAETGHLERKRQEVPKTPESTGAGSAGAAAAPVDKESDQESDQESAKMAQREEIEDAFARMMRAVRKDLEAGKEPGESGFAFLDGAIPPGMPNILIDLFQDELERILQTFSAFQINIKETNKFMVKAIAKKEELVTYKKPSGLKRAMVDATKGVTRFELAGKKIYDNIMSDLQRRKSAILQSNIDAVIAAAKAREKSSTPPEGQKFFDSLNDGSTFRSFKKITYFLNFPEYCRLARVSSTFRKATKGDLRYWIEVYANDFDPAWRNGSRKSLKRVRQSNPLIRLNVWDIQTKLEELIPQYKPTFREMVRAERAFKLTGSLIETYLHSSA